MGLLKQQTVSGVKWLVSGSILQKIISVAGTVVLARILDPYAFGLFALAGIIIEALRLFQSLGFDSALIQRKDDIEKSANTAFFLIPILGGVLSCILFISAPSIAKFLNNNELINILRALGLVFIISCFGKVPAALMEKNMRFKEISIVEITTALIFSISAVILAFLKYGVWSLVFAFILRTIYQNVIYYKLSNWRLKFQFDKKIALKMFNFGKFIFLGGVLWFLKMNLDNLLVSKVLGIAALGIYTIAFNISNFGADYFSNKVSRVIFPAFSKKQNETNHLKNIFLNVTKVVSTVACFIYIYLFLFSDELINLLYGKQWIEAIPVLKVLVFAGFLNTIPVAIGPLFNATGHPKVAFLINVFQVVLFVVFIVPMARFFGLIGVALVVTMSQLCAILITYPKLRQILRLNFKEIFLTLKPGFLGAITASVTIILIRKLCGSGYSLNFHLLLSGITIITSCLVFLITIYLADKTLISEFRKILTR